MCCSDFGTDFLCLWVILPLFLLSFVSSGNIMAVLTTANIFKFRHMASSRDNV